MSRESKVQDFESESVSKSSEEEKEATNQEAVLENPPLKKRGKLSEEDILKMFASDSSSSKTPSALNTPAAPHTSRVVSRNFNRPRTSVTNPVAEEVVVRESKRCGGCEIS